MRTKGKQGSRRSLAEQLSATFDDSLAQVAVAIDAIDADGADGADAPGVRAEALDFLLDDIDRAIDGVLRERERMLSSD
ncbi:MAG: hypothetical protein AB7P21_24300 [Lautropia sp.]